MNKIAPNESQASDSPMCTSEPMPASRAHADQFSLVAQIGLELVDLQNQVIDLKVDLLRVAGYAELECPDLQPQDNLDDAIKKKETELKAAASAWRSAVSLLDRLQSQYLDALEKAEKSWWEPAVIWFWFAEATRLKAKLWGAQNAEKAAWALVETRRIELDCLKKRKK